MLCLGEFNWGRGRAVERPTSPILTVEEKKKSQE